MGKFRFVLCFFFVVVGEGAIKPVKRFAEERTFLPARTLAWATASIGDASFDSEACDEFSRRLSS